MWHILRLFQGCLVGLCCWGVPLCAQPIVGKVTDWHTQPIAHAAIRLEGGQTGVLTQASGEFRLDARLQLPFRIRVSCVGYLPETVLVTDWAPIQVRLREAVYELPNLVVTATRTEQDWTELPVPMTVVTQQQIREMGSLRLGEVLQEQTGLAIVNDHGEGLQIQGFAPDYTLILVDGEPLIGRTAGTLELSRLAVGNIEQIEIVKGATSSIYGSEALAGVVNIITENPRHNSLNITGRYGTNQTSDLGVRASVRKGKWSGSLFANRYASGGYDFTPETFGQTAEPFRNLTLQQKWRVEWGKGWSLSVSGRYFDERQDARFEVAEVAITARIAGQARIGEGSINPVLEGRFGDRWKWQARFYHTRYAATTDLFRQSNAEVYEQTFFRQGFTRPEVMNTLYFSDRHILTAGAGHIWEHVEATRYNERERFQTAYAFAQHEWKPTAKWQVIAGARFDRHTVYGQQLSPKLATRFQVAPWLAVRASSGMGFKAPDFRQLYLNFNNNVAGYSVFGTEELPALLAQLQAQGQIAEVLLPLSEVGNLRAETSLSNNLGLQANWHGGWQMTVNLFRNHVDNLIESQVVARRTNGQNIFSYRNLQQIVTQGLEWEMSYPLATGWQLSAGYQYLDAFDREVVGQIRRGEIFQRDSNTLVTSRLQRQDYGGLMGRSRHMLNAKLFYRLPEKGFSANLRAVYRSRFGFADRNGNLVLDQANEYAPGFWNCHASVSKEWAKGLFRTQIGADNLLNFREATMMPNLPGRLLWASLQFGWQSKN